LPLVERVVGGRVADPPPGLLDRARKLSGSVEHRIALRRAGGHGCLDVTDCEIRPLDIRRYLPQHRREVIDTVPIRERLLPHGRMDQQVAVDLNRQIHAVLRSAHVQPRRTAGLALARSLPVPRDASHVARQPSATQTRSAPAAAERTTAPTRLIARATRRARTR
jgi:hypothetical protein